jgi:hypothetical protein
MVFLTSQGSQIRSRFDDDSINIPGSPILRACYGRNSGKNEALIPETWRLFWLSSAIYFTSNFDKKRSFQKLDFLLSVNVCDVDSCKNKSFFLLRIK